MKEEIGKLKSDDAVVWGGLNDIGKNNSQEALRHLCNFVKKRHNVNVVVMSASPRYDLIPSSCVNNEVVRFNHQLRKRMKMFKNVQILETDLKRESFTKHGLHLNTSGKEQITLKLAAVVRSLLYKNKLASIQLQWKENPTSPCYSSLKQTTGNGVSELSSIIKVPNNNEGTVTQLQPNKRQKKNPELRDQDFLWIT